MLLYFAQPDKPEVIKLVVFHAMQDALLEKQLGELPAATGVYLMKDGKHRVIYVGKARNIRARVRSYFLPGSSDERPFVDHLVKRVARVDYVITENDKEALILENSLIKQFKPRFNIQLRDDKTYVSVKIDLRSDFPRPVITRQRKQEAGVAYFGPYSSAASVRSTLALLNRVFPLRECSDYVLAHRTRPCPLHEMGRCSAPCVGKVSPGEYRVFVDEVIMVLKGRSTELVERISARMAEAAAELRFEDAARCRDQIRALEHIAERQRVESPDFVDRDVFAYHVQGDFMEIQALFVRHGRLEDITSFSFKVTDRSSEDVFNSFLNLFYSSGRMAPAEIVVPIELQDKAALSEYLSEQRGRKVSIVVPKRGSKARLLELARTNAESSYKARHGASESHRQVLLALKTGLGLNNFPSRIECFDISNIGGKLAVGSLVTFIDCLPDKRKYRHYRVRSVHQSDDYAMMYEVLKRRYTRGKEENDLPDLAIIDGGKGQLAIALRVLDELGINNVDVVALAKKRRGHRGRNASESVERVFLPRADAPIVLPQDSPHLLYITRIRDEAHRFAIAYHRKLRQIEYRKGGIGAISGVGPVIRKRLLERFGTARAISSASINELEQVKGVSRALAERIYAHFHSDNTASSESGPGTYTPRKGGQEA